jgi:hypothetical protein
MQPPSKLSVKNNSKIFKLSDILKCSLTELHRNLGIFMFPGLPDLFADNERFRSPNQVISVVKDVCKQSLTAAICFLKIEHINGDRTDPWGYSPCP